MNVLRSGKTNVDLDVNANARLRIERLARELRLTDQMLSLDLDTVNVVSDGPAPAWTTLDGDAVSFAYGRMPRPWTGIDVAVWLGTNAHELGHVLFSPRRHSTLMFRVLESDRAFLPGIAMLHNIVEDQRQERLLLARFAPWAGYLTAALGHHLVADDNSAWLLMAGRTWLPDDVRATAKARMVAHRGQRDTDTVTRIVGEYQRLTDPGTTEADEAWELLQELHSMFEDEPPTGGSGCGGGVIRDGDPDTTPPPPDGDGGGWPTADEDADPGGSGDDDGDTDNDDGDTGNGGDGDDGDADSDDDGGGDGSGNGDATDTTSTSTSGSGAGDGQSDPSKRPLDWNDTRKALKNAARDQIDANEDTRDDLDSVLDTLDYGRPGEDADGAEPTGRYVDATDSARRLHYEVGDALLDLKDESEPGWNKRTDSGRLNVRRLVSSNADTDTLFDRYDPGMMDAAELDVVLLLDVSVSMGGQTHPLAEAAWAIRHAVDDLEGTITVLTYDSGPHRVLAAPGVRPDGRMFIPQVQGGTQPKTAIVEAYRLLSGSDAKNRLFIILTDGEWFGGVTQNDEMIAEMGRSGITTVCALLGNGSGTDIHGCQYGATIDDPTDLARLFRRVAAERIASWR